MKQEPKIRLQTFISKHLYEAFQSHAKQLGVSMSELLRRAVVQSLKWKSIPAEHDITSNPA